MIEKNFLLAKLPPFYNKKTTLVNDQDTKDIIKAILKAHEQYKSDYDKICKYFVGESEVETAKNIFNYLKNNVEYIIEPDDRQLIKSPSAIFATPSSDCKNYALATLGILDACRRKFGYNCELYFRFAAYDGSTTPQHVFAVMKINGREYWIDAVLDKFNERREYNFKTDKKINNMALMAMSGVNPYGNYANAENRAAAINGFSFSNLSSQLNSFSSGINNATSQVNNILNNSGIQSALKLLPGGDIVNQILPKLNEMFGAKRGAAATEYGVQKYREMYPDVVAANYEPWAHYQENGWREGRYWFDNPSVTKETIDDYRNRYPDVARTWDNSILQHYLQYGKSEGRSIKLNLTPAQSAQIEAAISSGQNTATTGAGNQIETMLNSATTQTAGISPILILAIVGAGAAIFLSKKK